MARRLPLLALLLVGMAGPVAPLRAAEKAAEGERPRRLDEGEYYQLYKLLADAMDQVERNYVKEVSRRELMEAAIEGVISKLDPYSDYIAPDELEKFRANVESEFGGIGIQITMDAGQLKVLSPLIGTPAYRAGLRAGDRIVEIEGQSTESITLNEAVKRLKGETGTRVALTVLHARSHERETVSLEREIIEVQTVLGDRRKPNDHWNFWYDRDRGVGYIRVTAFSRETADDLRAALRELTKEGQLRGLILDLRFNPGGLLVSAIEICDMFVSKGRIVSTEGRNTKERVWDAHEAGTFNGFPMAVLVNRYSASASEIVSACLQDHDRAVIVGERTWGKGSVQNIIELEGGKSALKLTTAGYKRPSGENIHRFPGDDANDQWGVLPNAGYRLRLSDREMARLITDRRKRDIIAAHAAAGAPPEPREAGGERFEDRQLQMALKYLKGAMKMK